MNMFQIEGSRNFIWPALYAHFSHSCLMASFQLCCFTNDSIIGSLALLCHQTSVFWPLIPKVAAPNALLPLCSETSLSGKPRQTRLLWCALECPTLHELLEGGSDLREFVLELYCELELVVRPWFRRLTALFMHMVYFGVNLVEDRQVRAVESRVPDELTLNGFPVLIIYLSRGSDAFDRCLNLWPFSWHGRDCAAR